MAALIAGTGRGNADGGDGIRGIAPDARLLHYAVSYPDPADADETTCAITGPGYDEVADGVVASIRQAVADGARIINLSLAGGYDADYAPALLEAYRAGVILVAGTSNTRRDVLWPANGNGVVAVNPVDRDGLVYDDSVTDAANIGLTAPGEGVNSFGWDGGAWHSDYRSDGSSNATALVSGGLAAMWSAHPDATANQVLQAAKAGVGLRRTADGVQTWFRRDGEDLPTGHRAQPGLRLGHLRPGRRRRDRPDHPARREPLRRRHRRGRALPRADPRSRGRGRGGERILLGDRLPPRGRRRRRGRDGTPHGRARRHAWLVVGLVGLVLAGVATAAVLVVRRRRGPSSTGGDPDPTVMTGAVGARPGVRADAEE